MDRVECIATLSFQPQMAVEMSGFEHFISSDRANAFLLSHSGANLVIFKYKHETFLFSHTLNLAVYAYTLFFLVIYISVVSIFFLHILFYFAFSYVKHFEIRLCVKYAI